MTWKPNYRGTSQKGSEYDGPTRAPSPEQPEHEEARRMAEEAMPAQEEAFQMTEHEEARRLVEDAHKYLATPHVQTGTSAHLRHTCEVLLALLSKAEQEQDDLERQQDRDVARILNLQRELERLREVENAVLGPDGRHPLEIELERLRQRLRDFCGDVHIFPPDAKAGDACACGKTIW